MAGDGKADRDERKRRARIGLAMSLETACEDFVALQQLIVGELAVTPRTGADDPFGQIKAMRMTLRIQSALADSLIFNAARAVRICEEGAGVLDVDADERKAFVNGMKHIRLIRKVSEHGYDPKLHARRTKTQPTLHRHEEEETAVDETSLVIGGPEQMLKGPTNLWEAYQMLNRFRGYAGWTSLPPEYSALPAVPG